MIWAKLGNVIIAEVSFNLYVFHKTHVQSIDFLYIVLYFYYKLIYRGGIYYDKSMSNLQNEFFKRNST